MDVIKIKGGTPLKGSIRISGAKNSALPIIAASLLTSDDVIISNIPNLLDIITMCNLLMNHGTKIKLDCSKADYGRTIIFNSSDISNYIAPYDIVKKMRASVLVLGPLLGRFQKAKVSLPGGCAIGTRPIDLHVDALKKMGANINLNAGYIEASSDGRLKGAKINLDKPSVGATENIIMAATLSEGKTTIRNAAREPEIVDLVNCLRSMGAKIIGEGEEKIEIQGIKKLHGASHTVIPDRLEAATYAIAAIMTRGNILLEGINFSFLDNVFDKLLACGAKIEKTENGILCSGTKKIKAVDITTGPFPEFSTDLQAQFMALMCLAEGTSVITENIFENRFMHVAELNRMGANINISSKSAIVRGIKNFKGAEVMATDLRASVSLVLAGLVAKGQTIINRVYHIDRGYENIEAKLLACGANIERIKNTSKPNLG